MSAEKKIKDEEQLKVEVASETAITPTKLKKDEESKTQENKIAAGEEQKSPEPSVTPELPSKAKESADVVQQTEKEKAPAATAVSDKKDPVRSQSTFAMMKAQQNMPIQDLGKIKSLGQVLNRNILHQDPFQNMVCDKEKRILVNELQEKIKSAQAEREHLKETVLGQTYQRIAFVLGPDATEDDIQYVAEPFINLVDRYSNLVDDSRVEISSLNVDLEARNSEISMLSKENEKYLRLAGAGSKKTWNLYEELLGQERVVNRKFLHMMAKENQKTLAKAGRKNTYADYIANNSIFGGGEANGPFYPRRHRSPKY